MSRQREGCLLKPILIVGFVIIIVVGVIASRSTENDGPTRKQEKAYDECMRPFLPPIDQDDPGALPVPSVSTTTAPREEILRCERLLGG